MNDLFGLTVYLESLGCPKNLVDSELMLGLLKKHGCRITTDPKRAAVVIVNTCGFIEDAQQESINSILRLADCREKGTTRAIVVTGCLAQRYAKELKQEIPEIDCLVGTGEFYRIPEIIAEMLGGKRGICVAEPTFLYDHQWPRLISTPAHYAYIKAAEGCDNRCSFCVIPSLRGHYRSRDIESLLAEAKQLSRLGTKEIILIAQDTSLYGKDRYGQPRLSELLRRLCKIPGICWIRWLYGYPTRITGELIEVMAEETKICPYLDLPLQHISPRILRRMCRPSDPDQVYRLIEQLRQNIPDLALRTTFMVGFPGETSEDFQLLKDFVSEIEFDRMGVFKYSPVDGTPAAIIEEEVPEEVKEYRYHQLMTLQQKISLLRNQSWVGRTVRVMIEGIDKNTAFGRSSREAPDIDGLIYFTIQPEYRHNIGDMIMVKINSADYYDLAGEAVP